MGLAYLFALVVALGFLGVQIAMGARDGGAGHAGGAGHGVGHAAGHPGGHAHAPDEPAFWTLFLSLRFWTFAALGFGMSGGLIHAFTLASPLATFLIALAAAMASGLFAALAFRWLRRSATGTEAEASQAVGRVGRVVVACGRGTTGQVRVELAGASVDLLAATDEESIPRGEAVIVEDMRDSVARVSRRPRDLA